MISKRERILVLVCRLRNFQRIWDLIGGVIDLRVKVRIAVLDESTADCHTVYLCLGRMAQVRVQRVALLAGVLGFARARRCGRRPHGPRARSAARRGSARAASGPAGREGSEVRWPCVVPPRCRQQSSGRCGPAGPLPRGCGSSRRRCPPRSLHCTPAYRAVRRGARPASDPGSGASSSAMKPEPLSDFSTSGGPCSRNSHCRASIVVSAVSSSTGSQASWQPLARSRTARM